MHCLLGRERLPRPPQTLREGLALDELHHEVEERTLLSVVVDDDGVGMTQVGDHRGLLEEALAVALIELGGRGLTEDLHRDLASKRFLHGAIDDAHAPRRDRSLHAEPAADEQTHERIGFARRHFAYRLRLGAAHGYKLSCFGASGDGRCDFS